jgi:peptide/nickel transport system ATP-binding protein
MGLDLSPGLDNQLQLFEASNNPLLKVKDLCVEYFTPRGSVHAVDGVTLDVWPGEFIGLAGESGCGKSTIAQAILRVLHAPAVITGGEIWFEDQDVLSMDLAELERFRWQSVSLVFQSAMNALNPVMRIRDQITDVIEVHSKLRRADAIQRASELLDLVGIEQKRLMDYPHQLSGGMRQRVVIAIALALNPKMIIMDEPTTALDVVVQQQIIQETEDLKEKLGFSVMFITHDLSLLVEISDRIGIMYAGEIVELAPSRDLFTHPLHLYTQGLMSSFPALTGEREKLTGIPGTPPDLVFPPPGCRFHLRCPAVQPRCKVDKPAYQEVSPGHFVACHL